MAEPRLALRVLGPVDVVDRAGHPVGLGDRQRALIAVLVAARGRVVPADVLVEAVWPGERDRTGALHTQVSRLRRTLREAGAAARVETGHGGYALRTDGAGVVDAEGFEDRVSADDGRNGTDPLARAERLGDALALWRGPAYGREAELEAVELEAARLEELRTRAVELRADSLVAAGRPELVVAELEGLVRDQPLRESALGCLMRALYRAGRHVEALDHYRRHRTLLAEELGLDPSATLQQLERQILTHEVTDEAPAPASGTRLAGTAISWLPLPDGRKIACGVLGAGPTVLALPAWVTSLEVVASGRDPRCTLLERLSRHCRVVMYDRAGTGLSSPRVTDYSLDTTVAELEQVLEHTGPVTVLALSQAGPAAIAAAARRPDLVRGLALCGTFASAPDTFPDAATTRASVELVRAGTSMGMRLIAGLYRPDASYAAVEHLVRVLRESAPAEVAAGYLETMYATDVADLLPELTQPTLVVHYTGDKVVPFRGGRQLAASIPRATFVPLDGPFHLPDLADLDRVVAAVAGLAEDAAREQPGDHPPHP